MRVYGVFLVAILGGCGGGGGSGSAAPAVVSFGTVTANAPTVRDVMVPDPFAVPSSVEAVAETGPFRIADGALPALAPGGIDFALPVEFTPPSPGDFQGSVSIRFVPAGGGAPVEVTLGARATAEAAKPSTATASLDFGDVLVTASATRQVRLFNAAVHTSYEAGAPTLPAGFTIAGNAFPLTVPPRETRLLDLVFTPGAPGPHSFDLSIPHDAGGPPLRIPVSAMTSGWPEEMVVEYGDIALNGNGETPWLEVDVPQDAISFTVEATATASETLDLLALEWPGGYSAPMPPYGLQWATVKRGIRSVTVPWTDALSQQLTPGGGTYRFRFRRESGTAPTLKVRALIENRPGAIVSGGVLDLNIFVASNYHITPEQVPLWAQSTIVGVDAIFSTIGLKIGDVTGYVLDPEFDAPISNNYPEKLYDLFQQSGKATATRLNVFIVKIDTAGGVAGMVQGPASNGWSESGVAVSGFGNSQTFAHEIGHYLGLHHPLEGDAITDTGAGNNLMTAGGTVLTPGQAHVILRHPLVRSP